MSAKQSGRFVSGILGLGLVLWLLARYLFGPRIGGQGGPLVAMIATIVAVAVMLLLVVAIIVPAVAIGERRRKR